MLKIGYIVLSRLGALALLGYIAWLGWEHLGPRRPEIGAVRQELADQLATTIAEDIRVSRGDVRQAVLLHFGNDPTDYFTSTLRSVIEQTGVLNLRDRTVMEKARSLLNLPQPAYAAPDTALPRARQLDVPAVLYGTIHDFEAWPDGAKIDVEVQLADVSTGRSVFSKRYQVESPVSVSADSTVSSGIVRFPWLQRLLGWLLVVLLLPVFTIGFIRTMVRKASNATNAFVLGIYTLADALLAWLLIGAALTSWLLAAGLLLAVIVAFFYNIQIMTVALRLEEP